MKRILLIGLAALSNWGQSFAEIDYHKDIAPIFKEHCIKCHGPDKQKASLRVDQRASLMSGGDTGTISLVPGDAENSFFLEVLTGEDEDIRMPPKGDLLTQEEQDKIREWVLAGAPWEGQMDAKVAKVSSDHWSFQPLKKEAVPNKENNPIDAFILEKLKEKGLGFSEEADPRSLIKRASVILTGLLPGFWESSQFEKAYANNPQKAYNDLIDRLMSSKHFGERWAQHWLDVIRWAETNGSEANLYRVNAWVYRDYLIHAFNSDKPYDRFVKEQIAGDSLGAGEAMGFLVAGPHVPPATVGREPSAIRQARADRMDEIMQTVGASMMGVTVSCARCHNHKFDPMSIQDYYSMTGVFQDIEFGSRVSELNAEHPRAKKAAEIEKVMNTHRKALSAKGAWVEDWVSYEDLYFKKHKVTGLKLQFMSKNFSLDEVEVYGTDAQNINYARNSRGTEVEVSHISGHNAATCAIDGNYGTMSVRAKVDKKSKEKPWLELKFKEAVTIDQIRLSVNREYAREVDYMLGYKKPKVNNYVLKLKLEDGSWKTIANTGNLKNPQGELKKHHNALQASVAKMIEEGPRLSFTSRLIEPAISYVLHRGSPENRKAEVMPAGLTLLDGDLNLNSDTPGHERRLKFAEWLVSDKNPMTPRVMVNRLWHHIFGQGIVRTTSDFGLAGAMPTHPELLDWLSHEFVYPTLKGHKAWGVKDMIRLMVHSKAFKQSSTPNEKGISVDGGTQYLWRFPPKRMEAEVIRDGILVASDSLNRKIGGVSYRIHNVKKTYSQWEVVNNYGPETFRRMIYQERMREWMTKCSLPLTFLTVDKSKTSVRFQPHHYKH